MEVTLNITTTICFAFIITDEKKLKVYPFNNLISLKPFWGDLLINIKNKHLNSNTLVGGAAVRERKNKENP